MRATHYFVKIVAPKGSRGLRLRFSRAHLLFGLALAFVAFAAVAGSYAWTIERAAASDGALRTLTADQHVRLRSLAAHASQLDGELRSLQRQNQAIESLIEGKRRLTRSVGRAQRHGHADARARDVDRPEAYRASDDFATIAARIERLRAGSMRVQYASARLRRLALHIVNVRELQQLARVRVLAAIPSLNPAGDGVAIRSPFGWRADPWPEFHAGVDLDVDYGDNVRAAAAGTVVAAADAGDGYGIKVDIDHGNGYHTWYAHLSRADVQAGQRVAKGQHIALVGSTGESTGPHLHYQVMLDGKAVDPSPYLAGIPAPVLASIR